MSLKELLETRRRIKNRKPKFMRQDIQKKKKLRRNWRKPKGSDSKMRVKLKGYRLSVTKGWKSPEEVRGLTRDGLMPTRAERKEDLAGIDPKKQAVIIGSSVGGKKRVALIEEALKKGIKILNYREPQKKADQIKHEIQKKKAEREQTKKDREGKKEKAAKEAEKKKEKKEDKKEAMTEEEKKIEEKKEKDKLLISTQ